MIFADIPFGLKCVCAIEPDANFWASAGEQIPAEIRGDDECQSQLPAPQTPIELGLRLDGRALGEVPGARKIVEEGLALL